MAQNITTISLSKEELVFLTENQLSATRIVRNYVQELILRQKFGTPNPELLEKIERMHKIINDYVKYITDKGLIDDFLQKTAKK